MKSCLSKHIPETPKDEDGLRAMRAAAWHRLGIITIRIDEIEDELERRFLEGMATRMFGRRSVSRGTEA